MPFAFRLNRLTFPSAIALGHDPSSPCPTDRRKKILKKFRKIAATTYGVIASLLLFVAVVSVARRRPGSKYFPRTWRALMALVCFCFFRLSSDTRCHGTDKRPAERNFELRPAALVATKKKISWHCSRIVLATALHLPSMVIVLFVSTSPQSPYGDLSHWVTFSPRNRVLRPTTEFLLFFLFSNRKRFVGRIFILPKKTTFIRCYGEKTERRRR